MDGCTNIIDRAMSRTQSSRRCRRRDTIVRMHINKPWNLME